MRAFWYQFQHAHPFIAHFFGFPPGRTADDFEAAAPQCPVFRIGPPKTGQT
jgi:hypothetical protein